MRLSLLSRASFFAFVLATVLVACGSRSGLLVDETSAPIDATVDTQADREASPDAFDATSEDATSKDGFDLDVDADCPEPSHCDPRDPSKIFKCGVAIHQCGSLETCVERGESGAECVNPCVDTLGQDTSNGCEFFAVEPDITSGAFGACYAVFIVNQWKSGEPAKIEVSRGGQTLNVATFARLPRGTGTNITYQPYSVNGLAKDDIAILFLSRDPAADNDPDPTSPRKLAACTPGITPAVVGDAARHGTGRGTAFLIKTNVPVVAYQIMPYGGGHARVTSATLLLPTNVWEPNYLAMNAYPSPGGAEGLSLAVLGQKDNTTVRIRPTRTIQGGGGLAGTPANVTRAYTVNRGEYLQFTQSEELTGSAILADAPIAVIGGSTLMDIPVSRTRADAAHQMLPSVQTLGSEYVGVRYRGRRGRGDESVPWRVLGAVDGTQLTYEPSTPPGAPTTINARQVVEFNSPGPFVVKSQDANHPFYMAQYMTGGLFFGTPQNEDQRDGEGDPEFVNVVTPAQYLPRYVFFTDPTYPETNLVIVRAKDPVLGLFPTITLNCLGFVNGWQPVGTSGKYEFARVDISTGDFQGVGGCDNGVHTLEGTLPSPGDGGPPPTAMFGVTVWGWGNPITWPPFGVQDQANPRYTRWVSYGYPAGANFTKLNNVIVPAN